MFTRSNFKNMARTGLIVAAIIALSACSTIQLPWNTSSASEARSGSTNTSALTIDTRLAAGTLKLENTSLAVKPAQAKELAFLWKGARALSTNSTTSTQEMAALYQQIKETLTPEQSASIEQMNLTNDDVTALVKDLNASLAAAGQAPAAGTRPGVGQAQRSANGSSSASRSQSQGGMPGGFPGGMPPGDFGGMPVQGASGATTKSSAAASQSTTANRLGNSQLVDILIFLLDQRARS